MSDSHEVPEEDPPPPPPEDDEEDEPPPPAPEEEDDPPPPPPEAEFEEEEKSVGPVNIWAIDDPETEKTLGFLGKISKGGGIFEVGQILRCRVGQGGAEFYAQDGANWKEVKTIEWKTFEKWGAKKGVGDVCVGCEEIPVELSKPKDAEQKCDLQKECNRGVLVDWGYICPDCEYRVCRECFEVDCKKGVFCFDLGKGNLLLIKMRRPKRFLRMIDDNMAKLDQEQTLRTMSHQQQTTNMSTQPEPVKKKKKKRFGIF